MKHFLFVFFVSIISNISLYGQGKMDIDPLMLGPILIDQPNTEKMIDICKAYHLIEGSVIDGFVTYSHSNGTELRFKVDTNSLPHVSVVIVITDDSKKEIERVLSNTGYKKESGLYVKGSKFEHRRTKCKVLGGKSKTLTFEKEYNSF